MISAPVPPARSWVKSWMLGLVLTTATLAALLFVSDASFRNPASAEAEFVFTFRAYGEWVSGTGASIDPALDKRPVHMRTAVPAQRTRSPVMVQLEVDGRVEEHVYQPKGFKSDGTSVGELRVSLTPGVHRIRVSVATSPDPAVAKQTWSEQVNACQGRLSVLTLESGHGFQFEP